jgi:predicted adenine nucleotide alpha hydrolase (AANH) superfamily ATPase
MNYSNLLENKIAEIKAKGEKSRLLLHACCAPCSSYVLEYLRGYFDITLYFYNPNISPKEEYVFRQAELIRLVGEMGLPITVVSEKYSPEEFFEVSKGLEKEPEGGERCFKCYRLRLLKTAEYAKKNGFQFFTTTLSISPYKNAEKLNEIGKEISEKVGVNYLYSDFKKKNGYKRSIELSKEYNLYRQDYCGCIFSKEAK